MASEQKNIMVEVDYKNCDICGKHIQEIMKFPDNTVKTKELNKADRIIVIGNTFMTSDKDICNDCVNKILTKCCKELRKLGYEDGGDINHYLNPILY